MPKKPAARDRQCIIKSKSLEDILKTCDRNIRNISMTLMDTLQEGDDTPADRFYCNHYRESWEDLREDVMAMIAKQEGVKPDPRLAWPTQAEEAAEAVEIKTKYYAYIIEGTEHESGWGQRPDGVVAFKTEADATQWIAEYYKKHHASKTAPHDYTTYDKLGNHEVSFETFKKLGEKNLVHADRLHELQ